MKLSGRRTELSLLRFIRYYFPVFRVHGFLQTRIPQDPRGDQIKTSSANTSQGFTDLRRLVEAFKTQFSEFEAEQRKDFDARSGQLQRDMDNLQAQITK